MATLREFAQRIRRIGDSIPEGANRLKVAAAVAIDQTVVMATPVGDPKLWQHPGPKGYVGGRARTNWVVGIGHADSSTTEAVDFATALRTGRTQIEGAKPGQAVHISNNLPYIVPLNEGHSRQAPSGFIEQAVAAGLANVRNARILRP